MDHTLSTYCNWILSFIFIAAGVLKIFSPENTGDILIFLFEFEYVTSQVIVYSIAIIEVLLGLFLFFGVKKRLTQGLILFSCFIFLSVAIIGVSNGWEFACGCFGNFSFGRFDRAMVLRNSLLVVMSIWMIYGDSVLKNMTSSGVINQQSNK